MFRYTQTSNMSNDFVYNYYQKKCQDIFIQCIKKARELVPDEWERLSWLSETDIVEKVWKETVHPIFFYWINNRLMKAIQTKDLDVLEKESRQVGRFLYISLIKTGFYPESIIIDLDDRGELRFPGHPIYISLGEGYQNRSIELGIENESFHLRVGIEVISISMEDLLDTTKSINSPILKRKISIADNKIELDCDDPIVRYHIDNELYQIIKGHSLTVKEDDFPPLTPITLSDVWYYEKALDLVKEYWASMYTEIIGHIRLLVPLKTTALGGMTTSYFLGGIFLSHRAPDLFWTVENFIHEASHSRLDQLFEIDDIYLNEEEERYYSPWRMDLRPIKGIVHGLYVFIRVAQWYERLEIHIQSEEVRLRKAEVLLQIEEAIQVLQTHGKFTDLGEVLLKEMEDEYLRLQQMVPTG
ncbi:aKG-HExxH-type peptide beta-hydroxylase [Brevibacillus daliensis]|uniref:aKG-HExxH-type peptide beta-hydroxylase n=1 Tax=Brevibacillus daliensis TaxID=2892995 RepID=UPI001E6107F2|nr:HEXXH motif-containing putative peptide modification protein [Brevibacillus daliensis]